jgi:hypothetical protein
MLHMAHITMHLHLRLGLPTSLEKRGLLVTSLPCHVMLLLIRRELYMLGQRLDVWGLDERAVESLPLLFRYPLFEAIGQPVRTWGLMLLRAHLLGALLPLLIVLATV